MWHCKDTKKKTQGRSNPKGHRHTTGCPWCSTSTFSWLRTWPCPPSKGSVVSQANHRAPPTSQPTAWTSGAAGFEKSAHSHRFCPAEESRVVHVESKQKKQLTTVLGLSIFKPIPSQFENQPECFRWWYQVPAVKRIHDLECPLTNPKT